MSGYNGGGTWVRQFNWVADAAAGIKILASRQDAEWGNVTSGFNTAFCRDGQAPATGNFNMAGHAINNLNGGPVVFGTGGLSAVNGNTLAAALAGGGIAGVFINAADTFFPLAFISSTSFSIATDITANVVPGTVVRAVYQGTQITYGVVKSATFGGGITTVVVSMLFGFPNWDNTLSAVTFSIIKGMSLKSGIGKGTMVTVSNSVLQAQGGGAAHGVNFDTISQDQLGEWNAGTSTFTPLNSGRYHFDVGLQFSVNQQYTVGVYLGGITSIAYEQVFTTTQTTDYTRFQFIALIPNATSVVIATTGAAGYNLGTTFRNTLNITQLA